MSQWSENIQAKEKPHAHSGEFILVTYLDKFSVSCIPALYIYLCLWSTQKLFGKPVHGMTGSVFGREFKSSHAKNETKRSKPFNVEVHFYGVEDFALRCEKGALRWSSFAYKRIQNASRCHSDIGILIPQTLVI